MLPVETLKQFGVTTAESTRLNLLPVEQGKHELRQQLEAYTNEVLENQPVSLPYYYWFDKKQTLYTNPSCQEPYRAMSQFDTKERGGECLVGFDKLTQTLNNNPGRVVLWYSPTGPASFDNDPNNPYSKINYDYGQLYVNFFDGEKVHALAVKIGNEQVLRLFFPEDYFPKEQEEQISSITRFIRNPLLTGVNIDHFLDQCPGDDFVYRDNNGKEYSLHDVFLEMRNAVAGQKKTSINTFDKTIDELYRHQITEESLLQAYLQVIYNFQRATNQRSLSLSGSCGGSQISQTDIEGMLSKGILQLRDVVSIYSSALRSITQKDGTYYADYECPHCHLRVAGEKKGDPKKWKTACPHCGGKLGCGKK